MFAPQFPLYGAAFGAAIVTFRSRLLVTVVVVGHFLAVMGGFAVEYMQQNPIGRHLM